MRQARGCSHWVGRLLTVESLALLGFVDLCADEVVGVDLSGWVSGGFAGAAGAVRVQAERELNRITAMMPAMMRIPNRIMLVAIPAYPPPGHVVIVEHHVQFCFRLNVWDSVCQPR